MVESALAAVLAAAAIRTAYLQRRLRALEEQAITDPLTGAFNRRHMQDTLATAVERRRRTGERAALLLFDIDRFKRINDALSEGAFTLLYQPILPIEPPRNAGTPRVEALLRMSESP